MCDPCERYILDQIALYFDASKVDPKHQLTRTQVKAWTRLPNTMEATTTIDNKLLKLEQKWQLKAKEPWLSMGEYNSTANNNRRCYSNNNTNKMSIENNIQINTTNIFKLKMNQLLIN